jgi:hypothetical protein
LVYFNHCNSYFVLIPKLIQIFVLIPKLVQIFVVVSVSCNKCDNWWNILKEEAHVLMKPTHPMYFFLFIIQISNSAETKYLETGSRRSHNTYSPKTQTLATMAAPPQPKPERHLGTPFTSHLEPSPTPSHHHPRVI